MKGVFSKILSAVCLRSTFNKLKESVYHNDILVSHGVWHFFIRKIDNFHTTLMSWLSIMKRQIFGKHLVWKRFPFFWNDHFLKVEQKYNWTCRHLSTEAMSFLWNLEYELQPQGWYGWKGFFDHSIFELIPSNWKLRNQIYFTWQNFMTSFVILHIFRKHPFPLWSNFMSKFGHP